MHNNMNNKRYFKRELVFSFFIHEGWEDVLSNKWHLYFLKTYANEFDKVIFGINMSESDISNTSLLDGFKCVMDGIFKDIEIEYNVHENTIYRECAIFENYILDREPVSNEWITLFMHNKGITNTTNESLLYWIGCSYYQLLNDVSFIESCFIERIRCFAYGACKMKSSHTFNIYGEDLWIYSGTFFWVYKTKLDFLYGRENVKKLSNYIPHDRWYDEHFFGTILKYNDFPFTEACSYNENVLDFHNCYYDCKEYVYELFEKNDIDKLENLLFQLKESLAQKVPLISKSDNIRNIYITHICNKCNKNKNRDCEELHTTRFGNIVFMLLTALSQKPDKIYISRGFDCLERDVLDKIFDFESGMFEYFDGEITGDIDAVMCDNCLRAYTLDFPENYTNMVMCGLFQNTDYFETSLGEIKKYIKINNDIEKKVEKLYGDLTETVVVHVRRGDYVDVGHNKQFFVIPNVDYYIETYNKYYKGLRCIVVSDDIEWCKNSFGDCGFEFADETNDFLIDYIVMMKAYAIISSSSTFSISASLLSQNKLVVPYPIYTHEISKFGIKDIIIPNYAIKEDIKNRCLQYDLKIPYDSQLPTN